MTTRDDLEEFANMQKSLPKMRGEIVAKARAEGMTWRAIAQALDMTEHGVIKAQKAYEAERAGK